MSVKMNLNCPIPQLDFDRITLGHGSGGVLTHKLLDSGVFDLLSNEILDKKHDGAFLNLEGEVAMSTDSFVVNPVFFPGGDIGELAINGTVNDLAMCGAIPKYLSLAFIIEEGLLMQDFWNILVSIKAAAERAGVKVVTGDTKVVERGKGDQIFINTTGIGTIHPKAKISDTHIKNGDKIIVSNSIANHGIAIMSVREGLEFETEILSDTCALNEPALQLIENFADGIHVMRDPTRGGLGTVLAEIAKDQKIGIDIAQTAIPVEEQVNGACELLGLDPLYVANEGVFITIVEESIANEVCEKLKAFDTCAKASVIGEIVDDHKGQVIIQSAIGGRRVVNMLPGEQLPRIC